MFKNAKDLEISVGNSYSKYQLMYTVLENFQKGGKCSAQIASHQAESRGEEIVLIKIIIYICLANWLIELGQFSNKYRNIKFFSIKVQSLVRITPIWTLFRRQRKDKGNNKSPLNSRNSNNKHTECNGPKTNMWFRRRSKGHWITKFPKPDTLEKKVH